MSGTSDFESIRELEAKGYSYEDAVELSAQSEQEETVIAELIEDDEDEFADVPQGKPTGTRLFEGAERKEEACSTCQGVGWYEITVFSEPDENGDRHPMQIKKGCATCYGTGRETVVVLG